MTSNLSLLSTVTPNSLTLLLPQILSSPINASYIHTLFQKIASSDFPSNLSRLSVFFILSVSSQTKGVVSSAKLQISVL